MWKALIKLVEKWAYRCEHDWESIIETQTFYTAGDRIPHTRKYVYRCTKCGEPSIIQV